MSPWLSWLDYTIYNYLMAQKAFIFDLDGVIIDSETWWDKLWPSFETGLSIGHSIKSEFQAFKKQKPTLSWNQFFIQLNQIADKIYPQAPLTPGINQLLDKLIKNHYRLGLVSGSTAKWINYVLARLDYPIPISLSLHDHSELRPKPAPDGYLEAMKILKVNPQNSVILEDSQIGIDSAKTSGAFTICLTEHHPKNYHPKGANLYVKNLAELLKQLPIKILPRSD